MAVQEYSIAPGFNNTAGYVVIESQSVSGKRFASIQGVGTYDTGDERVKVSAVRDDVGDELVTWLSTWMTWAQYEWVIATPLQGKRSNLVTARLRLTGATYYNYNAILTMPKTSVLARTYNYYVNVVWSFTLQGLAS